MNELSKDLNVTPRYVTNLVTALEADGMVARSPHATDGRATVITLTTKGSSLGILMSGPHQEAVAKLFSRLTDPERRTLLSLLGKVRTEPAYYSSF